MPSPILEVDDAPAMKTVSPLTPLKTLLKPLASLQLTVTLFALSLILVFFGTLAQKNSGIWSVVAQYFWSWIVYIDPQLMVEFGQVFLGISTETRYSGPRVPFPAGKLLGIAMFVNLIAAHTLRFRLTWRRAGIFIIHGGMLLMFVNEYVAREFSVEQQMHILEGETAGYTFDTRYFELAIVDGSGPATDRVVAVPATRLTPGRRVVVPEVPFDVRAVTYYPNSKFTEFSDLKEGEPATPAAANGFGRSMTIREAPVVSGVDTGDNKFDNPSTQVELLRKGTDEVLATYLLSMTLKDQEFSLQGKTWSLSLRNIRYYKPYKVSLRKVKSEFHPGSRIPREYSSQVTLKDAGRSVSNDTTIAMNEPMRYGGETFYQSGVMPGDRGTILQVVENPGWLLPYFCCGVVGFGLVLHFGMHLGEYLRRLLAKRDTAAAADKKEAERSPPGVALFFVNIGLLVRAFVRLLLTPNNAVVPQSRFEKRLPWIVLAVTAALVVAGARPHGKTSQKGIDLEAAGKLPVLVEGRVKPLDSAARVALRKLNHKESYVDPADGANRSALDWWFATVTAGQSDSAPGNFAAMIRIESDQMLNFFGLLRRDGLRYSMAELRGKMDEFGEVVRKAEAKDKSERDIFDAKALELSDKLQAWLTIWMRGTRVIPPAVAGGEWSTVTGGKPNFQLIAMAYVEKHDLKIETFPEFQQYLAKLPPAQQEMAMAELQDLARVIPSAEEGALDWTLLFRAYQTGDAEKFKAALAKLQKLSDERVPEGQRSRNAIESFLNDTGLFWWCTALYILAFVLTAAAWICYSFDPGLGLAWRRSAVMVLLFTFAIHTFTLLARMYVTDRWFVFVTNLYSTAVFIGWAAVGLALVVERIFPITLGAATAAAIGFLTTQLAHTLAVAGDTIEPMRAVLNTTFWLATHVTTINLGYSATYLAGFVGAAYVLLGLFTPRLHREVTVSGQRLELGRLIGQILYGAIAGATVLSFIGTVLGGIWGDQSWGRFWGWDPKENGALMIVIWNVLILHARWAGMVKDRGMAVLALGGNIITTWSYFGTNQLGVGLHAYGFSNTLAAVCVVMWGVNLLLVAVGLIPQKYWRSRKVV